MMSTNKSWRVLVETFVVDPQAKLTEEAVLALR